METKLSEEKFKPLFSPDWWEKIRPFFLSGGFDKIYEYLKFESGRGKRIAPLSNNTYRCFFETPLKDLKGVILGFCPYHTFKNFMPIADGLAMGCSTTGKLQPSLELWYNSVEKELYNGLSLEGDKNPDLTFLAHQGILLFNSSLTTEMNKAGSHMDIWEPFTKFIFEEILAIERVPVMFLGREASKFKRYMPLMSWGFEVSHPASASYKNEEWTSGGALKQFITAIKDQSGKDIQLLDFSLPF